MKKGLLASYVSGICDGLHGESYSRILRLFFPEFITALVLYSMLYLLDAKWIADLKSTSTYATLGVTNTLLHFIVKVAEGLSVGTIILTGKYNGMRDYKEAGRSFVDAFWTTVLVGGAIATLLFFGASWIYKLYGVPDDMVALGVPFLRLRALGVFFTFVYFAFIGFLRGIKNTKTPMKIFISGGVVFLFFDYVLIFGKLGFPQMRLQGSALAGVIQYAFMLFASLCYLLLRKDSVGRKYSIQLFSVFRNRSRIKELLTLSWPVVIDKATLAAAYIWLGAMIAPMGTFALATFSVIKDLERFAILPAVAFAQVVTLLISNDYGEQDWEGIKSNTKKIVFMTSIMVMGILLVFSLWPKYFIQFFDKNGDFTDLAATIFPILSVLVFFDLLQLILSGALRGAANVKTVMMTRLIVCLFCFVPVSYILSRIPIEDIIVKFVLVYGSFYIGNALMSIVYINRFRSEEWKLQST
jgi:putative MATE family efflux protein